MALRRLEDAKRHWLSYAQIKKAIADGGVYALRTIAQAANTEVVENVIKGNLLDLVYWTHHSKVQPLVLDSPSDAVAFFKPLKGDGIRLKFWKNQNRRVYRVARAEKLSRMVKITKNVE